MTITEKIAMWWKSLTPVEKVNAVFKGITTTATIVGAGCCIHETRKSRAMMEFAVDKVGEGVEVEISQDLIDTAVAKAANAQIAKTVKVAVDRDWKTIQDEARKQVNEAVKTDREKISDEVADILAKECEKIHKADILSDIRDKAKDTLAEKLDEKLDDITDEYSRNLSNMGKVYEALADKLNSKA